eukprot:TRINITY_DN5837_c0_g1_i5.p1 TRINITY_DN5837_c0_g1~~TRINITY_DN5837_c0_g1_i5.p1  ORF type:complete len:248 (-),score=61.91 TRINITY_DN5837_c0_g1_i5:49-732(-)
MKFLLAPDTSQEGLEILVNYDGWSHKFNEWIRVPSARIMPLGTHPGCGGKHTGGIALNPQVDLEVERMRALARGADADPAPFQRRPVAAPAPPRDDGEVFIQLLQMGYNEDQAMMALAAHPGGLEELVTFLNEQLRYEQLVAQAPWNQADDQDEANGANVAMQAEEGGMNEMEHGQEDEGQELWEALPPELLQEFNQGQGGGAAQPADAEIPAQELRDNSNLENELD